MQVTNDTCRVCLGKKNLSEIFKNDIAKKIKFCASVQLSEDDELPKMICKQCLFYLDIAYVFRYVCELTDAKLRKQVAEKKRLENNNENDQYMFISSPVANEVIIGGEVEEDLIELPVTILLNENYVDQMPHENHIDPLEHSNGVTVEPVTRYDTVEPRRTTVKPLILEPMTRYNTVDPRTPGLATRSDAVKPQTPEPVTRSKTAESRKSESVPELPNKISESSSEPSSANVSPKVGRHTARKKQAKCAKRIPTVQDKSRTSPDFTVIEDERNKDGDLVQTDEQLLKSYQCDECDKSFPYKSHLERHSSVHSGVKEYKCDHCDKKFVKQYNLTVHLQKHTGNFRHKCKECGQGFSSPSVLKRHMNSHTKNASFQCKFCPKKLLHASSLKLHEKMHVYRPTYTCDVCFKVFSYTNSLTEHKKTHQSLKGNVCSVCGKQFNRKTSLRRHMLTHAPKRKINVQNKFTCDECHKKFASKELLIRHLQRHLGISNK